jgi:hypothetical protein
MQVWVQRDVREAPERIPYTCCHGPNIGWASGAAHLCISGDFRRNLTARAKIVRGTSVAPFLRVPWQAIGGGKTTMTPERTGTADEVLRRVQGEFLEMPGLRLTEPQARRLWGLDAASCDALLGALVEAKFLFKTRDGAFMRVETAAPLKAALRPRRSVAAA